MKPGFSDGSKAAFGQAWEPNKPHEKASGSGRKFASETIISELSVLETGNYKAGSLV